MFTTFTPESAEQVRKMSELLERKAEKMQELADIDSKLGALGFGQVANGDRPTVTVGPPRQAETKSKTKTPASDKPDDKPTKGKPRSTPAGDKQQSLESLLVDLVKKSKNGLALHEMVELALKAGYKSSSKDFHNMVQQAVGRLMKKKVLTRDDDTMRYNFQAEAA